MPPRKRAGTFETSRLTILASGDERPFLEYAIELLTSNDRLAREAAIEALVERPLAGARGALLALYDRIDADGLKHDQGARMRTGIIRVLRRIADTRDADLGIRAADTYEVVMSDDIARMLRAEGLRLVAELSPELFPYIAVEHLGDWHEPENEPANTAFQLLAGANDFALIYQWLLSADSDHVSAVFELFSQGPLPIVRRFATVAVASALRSGDEPMCTLLAETIVEREIESGYAAIERMMAAKISDELYAYLSMLLASTNRAPLLAILEEQLLHGRRRATIVGALQVRSTPEQTAILQRWEDRD